MHDEATMHRRNSKGHDNSEVGQELHRPQYIRKGRDGDGKLDEGEECEDNDQEERDSADGGDADEKGEHGD